MQAAVVVILDRMERCQLFYMHDDMKNCSVFASLHRQFSYRAWITEYSFVGQSGLNDNTSRIQGNINPSISINIYRYHFFKVIYHH